MVSIPAGLRYDAWGLAECAAARTSEAWGSTDREGQATMPCSLQVAVSLRLIRLGITDKASCQPKAAMLSGESAANCGRLAAGKLLQGT